MNYDRLVGTVPAHMTLPERLRWKAQNDEMIDSHFTESGRLMNEAADHIVRVEQERDEMLDTLRSLLKECAMIHKHWGEGCNQQQSDAAIARAKAIVKHRESEEIMGYHVFHRTFWKFGFGGRLIPCLGPKTTIAEGVETEAEAREMCREYNDNNDPGPLSDKAEYERED